MTAKRLTPTQGNGGSDNGVSYTNAVDTEVEFLHRVAAEWLINVAGTGDIITANTDSTIVEPLVSILRNKAFWYVAASSNTGAATIAIDGLAAVAIKDRSGNALAESALTAGDLHLLAFDGTNLRLLSSSASGTASSEFEVQGGRLTITTGTPVLSAATTGQSILYWTPYLHNRIGLYDGAAWSILSQAEKQIKATDAQSGGTHNGTKIIDGLTDTSQLVVGMKISGTNVGGGATIQSVDSATQVTATVNSTGTATNTMTFKLPANTGYDVYGKKVSSALKLFLVARAALFTATTNTTQDAVPVKSGDTTLRWLGWFKTSNTDGLIDYSISGQYRFAIWNQDNRIGIKNVEFFTASGTYYKSPATRGIVGFAEGGVGEINGSSTTGGTSSFGAHISGVGAAGFAAVSTNSSSYVARRTSSGFKFATSIGTTETVTVATQGSGAYVEVLESLEI